MEEPTDVLLTSKSLASGYGAMCLAKEETLVSDKISALVTMLVLTDSKICERHFMYQ